MTEPLSPASALLAASASGELSLTPGAARTCADACDTYITGLEALRAAVLRQIQGHGFGTLPSGIALGAKFDTLTGTLPEVLAQHIEVAMRLKSVFEEAGRRYDETDSNVTVAILAAGD